MLPSAELRYCEVPGWGIVLKGDKPVCKGDVLSDEIVAVEAPQLLLS